MASVGVLRGLDCVFINAVVAWNSYTGRFGVGPRLVVGSSESG